MNTELDILNCLPLYSIIVTVLREILITQCAYRACYHSDNNSVSVRRHYKKNSYLGKILSSFVLYFFKNRCAAYLDCEHPKSVVKICFRYNTVPEWNVVTGPVTLLTQT
jgi:hypothetical protein